MAHPIFKGISVKSGTMLSLCGYQSCLRGKRGLSSLDDASRNADIIVRRELLPPYASIKTGAIYNVQQKVHKGREERRDNIIQVKNVSSATHTSGESRGGHIRINKAEGAPRTCKKSPFTTAAANIKY